MMMRRARSAGVSTARAMWHMWLNGERKLIVAFAISVVGMGIIVSALVYQFAPGHEQRDVTIGLGKPSAAAVASGNPVVFTYRQCNDTGQDGTSLLFGSWVEIEKSGGALIVAQNAMQGGTLVTAPAPQGCKLFVSNPVPAPIAAGMWQRIGLVITVFLHRAAELNVISTEPITVVAP